jgi:hypothetical protein
LQQQAASGKMLVLQQLYPVAVISKAPYGLRMVTPAAAMASESPSLSCTVCWTCTCQRSAGVYVLALMQVDSGGKLYNCSSCDAMTQGFEFLLLALLCRQAVAAAEGYIQQQGLHDVQIEVETRTLEELHEVCHTVCWTHWGGTAPWTFQGFWWCCCPM